MMQGLTTSGHTITGGQTSAGVTISGRGESTTSVGIAGSSGIPRISVSDTVYMIPLFKDDVVPFPGTKEAESYIAKVQKHCSDTRIWRESAFNKWKSGLVGAPNTPAMNHPMYMQWANEFYAWISKMLSGQMPVNMSTTVPPFPPMPPAALPPANTTTASQRSLPNINDLKQRKTVKNDWSYADYIDNYTWTFCEMWDNYTRQHEEYKKIEPEKSPDEDNSKPPEDSDPQDDGTPDELKEPELIEPPPTTTPSPDIIIPDQKMGVNKGAIIAVGGVVVALLGLAGFAFYMKRRGT